MATIEAKRAQINAIDDGALWVIETSSNALCAGDLIMTSAVPGYGMVQDDDYMRAHTVAKLTMDCDFEPTMVKEEHVQVDASSGRVVLDPSTLLPTWVADEGEEDCNRDCGKLDHVR